LSEFIARLMTQHGDFILKEVQIRQACETDAEALARLVAELDYPTEASLVNERLSDLHEAGDCLLVAIYQSQVIGMALLHRTRFLHRRPDGRISTLGVFESYRSRGVGVRLIEAAEAVFRKWGCGRIEVSSGAKRQAAHRFYIREGFTEQPKRFIKLLED
jgi:GNAT superfamily N-acetyltransferase